MSITNILNQSRQEERNQLGHIPSEFESFKATFRREMEWVIRLFETLQKVPPNTDIHYSQSRRNFIITAPNLPGLPGAQTVANFVKGHDPEGVSDILKLVGSTIRIQCEKLIYVLAEDKKNQSPNIKQPFYRTLYRVRLAFESALDAGLNNVIKTYQEYANMEKELKDFVYTVKGALPKIETLQEELGPQSKNYKYCVESDFTDLEWEQLCEESLNQPAIFNLQSMAKFAVSLAYNQIESWRNPDESKWWNKIEVSKERADEGDLYLGALPVHTPMQNTLEDLKKQGICAVLSVVESFENQSEGFLTSAITPDQLKEAQFKQLQIPITDFDTGSLDDVQRGVAFIDWNIRNGRSIYVHCKAGRGRSALMIAAYLIKHKGLKSEEALELIKKYRPQAGFAKTDPKMATLLQYEILVLQKKLEQRV